MEGGGGGGREGVRGGRGIKGCHRKYDNREICDITSTLQGTTAVIHTNITSCSAKAVYAGISA